MKVSVITICFNAEDTIEDTIKSVLSQNYNKLEYIIKDGGSNDNTLKIIDQYKDKITKIISCKDEGLYDALNQAITSATGDVIGFIHADDVFYDESVISTIAKAFDQKDVHAVYGDLQYVYKNDTSKVYRNWKALSYKEGMFLKGWMPPHPTFYVRREVYNKFGLYNTTFKSAGDYELMLRYIHKYRISLHYIQKVLVKMRVGGKSNVTFKNRIRANMEDRRAWKINGLTPSAFTLLKKPLSKLGQFLKKE